MALLLTTLRKQKLTKKSFLMSPLPRLPAVWQVYPATLSSLLTGSELSTQLRPSPFVPQIPPPLSTSVTVYFLSHSSNSNTERYNIVHLKEGEQNFPTLISTPTPFLPHSLESIPTGFSAQPSIKRNLVKVTSDPDIVKSIGHFSVLILLGLCMVCRSLIPHA